MRWIIMAGDVLLVVACIIALCGWPLNPVVWLIVGMAFLAWRDSGGSFVWKRWR